MPVYTYRCNECGQEFEYKQAMKDKALTVCPEEICKEHNHGSAEVTRVISKSIGLVFKGSGFYLTDYKKKNSSVAAKDSGSSEVKSSEETKTTSETKTTDSKKTVEAKTSADSKPSTESAKQAAE
jgi:putative FmdB family regulatory protein